jgi:hypothetical protein
MRFAEGRQKLIQLIQMMAPTLLQPKNLNRDIISRARACSSVDRASGSGPAGRGFDSLHARILLYIILLIYTAYPLGNYLAANSRNCFVTSSTVSILVGVISPS